MRKVYPQARDAYDPTVKVFAEPEIAAKKGKPVSVILPINEYLPERRKTLQKGTKVYAEA